MPMTRDEEIKSINLRILMATALNDMGDELFVATSRPS